MNKKTIIWLVAAAVAVGGVVWLLTSEPTDMTNVTPSGKMPSSSGTVLVEIKGLSFIGKTTKITPGTKIILRNLDDAKHSIIGADFQSGPLKKGETYSHVFTHEGTYPYYDGIQPDTSGEIIVRQSNF